MITEAEKNTRIEHVKKIMEWEKIPSQRQFAKRLGMKPSNLSNYLTGKYVITEKFAKKIQQKFPDTKHDIKAEENEKKSKYSLAWILGEEDFPNQLEKSKRELEESYNEVYIMESSVKALARLGGFEFTYNLDGEQAEDVIEVINNNYISISHENINLHLSLFEWNSLMNNICDYVAFAINHHKSN